MRQILLLTILGSTLSFLCSAQQGTWTWMNGDSILNSPGNYGTMGAGDSTTTPPGVSGGAQWVDKDGNFWLFGGWNGQIFNALWKFDPLINTWTWMKGGAALNDPGNYGVQGVASPFNNPGARFDGVLTWTDVTGNLWMYGGYGFNPNGVGELSDLWKYEIATNEWTWMGGTMNFAVAPSHGQINIPSSSNDPGSRYQTYTCFTDESDYLLFFGGRNNNDSSDYYGDLWQYDIAANLWTWVGGSNQPNDTAKFGIQGIPDTANLPSTRFCYAGWSDSHDHLWLLSGNDTTFSNSMWKYYLSGDTWVWMNGMAVYDSGYYPIPCADDTNQLPWSKFLNTARWRDDCDHFWNFGGLAGYAGLLNDLWQYNLSTNEWHLVSGSKQGNHPGHFGIKEVADVVNIPSGRYRSNTWKDLEGNLWLFGGEQWVPNGLRNDLWKYTPDPNCYGCIPDVTAADNFLCEKFCTDFTDTSDSTIASWLWQFPGGTPSSSTDQSPANICYNTPGSYDVILITGGPSGNDTITLQSYITVHPTPLSPTITQVANTLTSSNAVFYQWQFNTVDIPGATGQSYIATQTGLYTVVITDLESCQNSATIFVEITGINDPQDNVSIAIYPNPSNGHFIIEWTNALSALSAESALAEKAGPANEISIEVVNTLGQRVFTYQDKISSADWKKEMDLRSFPAGMYLLKLNEGKFVQRITFIK